jgi:ATP-dependent RNA helicase RhlE
MLFSGLKLIPPLLQAIEASGYTTPTPIQEQAIPPVLEGRDLLGCAQTGTGKTAAFALPILQRLAATPGPRGIRVLIVTPTRELASQIGECLRDYGQFLRLRHVVIFGGVSQMHQERALRDRPEIVVATPGRLLDLIHQGHISLGQLEVLVLDEADRMLDMGFVNDVKKIVAQTPKTRQTLLFSATMPTEIEQLAASFLKSPVRVAVTPVSSTVERIEQSVYFAERAGKRALLAHLLADKAVERALVFARTKHGADRIATQLGRASIVAVAIHGDKSQPARERALRDFREGRAPVLVATDLAARGLDIDGVSHVFNHDLPDVPESYVHRIGRTARAGASGIAISFCSHEEREQLADIEKLIRRRISVVDSPIALPYEEPPPPARPAQGRQGQRQGRAPQAPRGSAPAPRGSAPRPAGPPRDGGRPHPSRDNAPSPAAPPPAAPPPSGPRADGGGRRRSYRPSR